MVTRCSSEKPLKKEDFEDWLQLFNKAIEQLKGSQNSDDIELLAKLYEGRMKRNIDLQRHEAALEVCSVASGTHAKRFERLSPGGTTRVILVPLDF